MSNRKRLEMEIGEDIHIFEVEDYEAEDILELLNLGDEWILFKGADGQNVFLRPDSIEVATLIETKDK